MVWALERLTAIVAVGAILALVAPVGAGSAMASGGQNPRAGDPNPLIGQVWWDQNTKWNQTWNGYRSALRAGRSSNAAKILRLAETPQFRWWGRWEQPIVGKLTGTFALMDQQVPGLVPLIAVFGHEGSGCGPHYTGGGAAEDARYRRWVRGVAQGIGNREAVIAFEPDSIGTVDCLARSRRSARLRTLAYGVRVLSQLPRATIYIDAGASDWLTARTAVSRLKAVGVRRVRGFMLNATHQTTTGSNIRYGLRVSRALGGKHFIINTSHNGNGPDGRLPYRTRWCNPPNAAAGALPTTGPLTGRSTPTCGSSARGSRTAPAAAARRLADGGRGAPCRWSSGPAGGGTEPPGYGPAKPSA